MLTGGADVDPAAHGEEPLPALGKVTPERDASEISLVRAAMDADKPVLAICRGMQVLNAAMGGSLHQDLNSFDGVIEAIESLRHSFALGVQWHPEHTAEHDPFSRSLFASFVRASIKT